MVRWLRWHCPPDTGFEIRALAVWGRARYLSVTEAPHNTDFHTWVGKKHFCFFQTAETGNRTPNSGVKGSGANHHPRAPAPDIYMNISTSPDPAQIINLNFQPLELVSRYRDAQLQVTENYWYLFNLTSNSCKYWCLSSHFISNKCDVIS